MEPLGWLTMSISVGSVLLLVAFCLNRVLMLPPAELPDQKAAPLDTETDDPA